MTNLANQTPPINGNSGPTPVTTFLPPPDVTGPLAVRELADRVGPTIARAALDIVAYRNREEDEGDRMSGDRWE